MSGTTRVMHCTPRACSTRSPTAGATRPGWSGLPGSARSTRTGRPSAPGSTTPVGAWPVLISDTTVVEEVDAPHRLSLRVKAWPTGEGRVILTRTPQGDDTEVTIEERAVSGPATLIPTAAQDFMLHQRNVEALRRLGYLAESWARGHEDDGDVARTRPQGG